jgi:hypothetical protein
VWCGKSFCCPVERFSEARQEWSRSALASRSLVGRAGVHSSTAQPVPRYKNRSPWHGTAGNGTPRMASERFEGFLCLLSSERPRFSGCANGCQVTTQVGLLLFLHEGPPAPDFLWKSSRERCGTERKLVSITKKIMW